MNGSNDQGLIVSANTQNESGAFENKVQTGNAGGFAPADRPAPSQAAGDGFMNIPDGIDEELPFN